MYMQRTTSGAADNGLYTTIKYMRSAADIGLGTTIKHLRRTTSGAAENGLGATMKYLRRTTSAEASNVLSTTIISSCSAASFEESSEPHTGERLLGPFVCGARASLLCSFKERLLLLLNYRAKEPKRNLSTLHACLGFLKHILKRLEPSRFSNPFIRRLVIRNAHV
jgi:hypothetical protein